jgi:hypothetical protein
VNGNDERDHEEEAYNRRFTAEENQAELAYDSGLLLRWFNRDGQDVTMLEYVLLNMRDDYRRVAETMIGDARVSTVWIGVPRDLDTRPPLIFETRVFGALRSGRSSYCERYATEPAALAGHDRAVAWVRDGMPDREQAAG